jgi:hypothetical protein
VLFIALHEVKNECVTGDQIEPTIRGSRFSEESWRGGYYELGIVLGPASDRHADQRIQNAVRAVWAHPSLHGPFFSRRFHRDDSFVDLTNKLSEANSLYGIVRLPFGETAFTTVVLREEFDPFEDWLYLSLPLGELANIHPLIGGYPFTPHDDGSVWTPFVETILLSIASEVARHAGFDRGFIGFEVAGFSYEQRTPVPQQRNYGVLLGEGDHFTFFPANMAG